MTSVEEFFCDVHQLGRDALALQILYVLDFGILLNAENPAGLQGSRLAVNQVADFYDIAGVFENPVIARKTAVEEALFDVSADFLSADETPDEFGVVNRGLVGAGAFGDFPTRFREERDCGFFEAAFGKAYQY